MERTPYSFPMRVRIDIRITRILLYSHSNRAGNYLWERRNYLSYNNISCSRSGGVTIAVNPAGVETAIEGLHFILTRVYYTVPFPLTRSRWGVVLEIPLNYFNRPHRFIFVRPRNNMTTKMSESDASCSCLPLHNCLIAGRKMAFIFFEND